MMPQRVPTMGGPNVGAGMSSGHGSALVIARSSGSLSGPSVKASQKYLKFQHQPMCVN
jgi:hypothetical protein